MSDKTSDKRLLPCPFCGGEAEVVGGNPYHWVFCKNCDAETKQSATIDGAIRIWNTRKPVDAVLDRLEEYMDDFMDDIYDELRDDTDNIRANRIIERFDDAIMITKEGLA